MVGAMTPRMDRGRRFQDDMPGRRLFIAVPVPEAVRLFVSDLVERVRELEGDTPEPAAGDGRGRRRGGRWVSLDSLHLTLRFLGATPDDQLLRLREVVDAAARRQAPFRVAIGGGGAFPSVERPRAIWLGVADADQGMKALAASVNHALMAAGFEGDDRPFTPHLTLARTDGVRSGPRLARRLVAEAMDLEAWFEVDRVILYESHTGRGPARYESLHEAPLGG
jgi:2'-5' RNA ligase